jgi:hypothetical protein
VQIPISINIAVCIISIRVGVVNVQLKDVGPYHGSIAKVETSYNVLNGHEVDLHLS